MKLTEDIIKQIDDVFSNVPYSDLSALEMTTGDEVVRIDFPREPEIIELPVEKLLKYIVEIEDAEDAQIEVTKVRSKFFTQMPVFCSEKSLQQVINEIDFTAKVPNEYTIRLVDNPFLIGFAATKLGFYDKYMPPCSTYFAVEIEYNSEEKRLGESQELKVLKSFLFELSYLTNAAIDFTSINDAGFYYDYDPPEEQHIEIEHLTPYTEGMDLYRKALEATDPEISFLYFYKIIEFYSPVAAKTTAYENLSRKIETLRYKNFGNTDLAAIFSIADQFRVSLSDKELAQALLSISIDIVDLFPKLPENIRKKISKNVHFNQNELDYQTKGETLQGIITQVGNILYSTRNSIVHAKSNYISNKMECDTNELPMLNEFLKGTCYMIIKWNDRLPGHLKFEE